MKIKATLCALLVCLCLPAFAQGDGGFPAGMLGVSGGRYVFGQISTYARHQFMLDTHTGRLWKLVCIKTDERSKECSETALDPTPYLTESGGRSGFSPPDQGRR